MWLDDDAAQINTATTGKYGKTHTGRCIDRHKYMGKCNGKASTSGHMIKFKEEHLD
jgi:hypothetical protein